MNLFGETPFFAFFLAALATWRVTHLLNSEDGPFDVVVLMRKRAGDGFIGHLMDCFYCLSIWISLPLAYCLADTFTAGFLYWLALSASSILIERLHVLMGVWEQFHTIVPQFQEEEKEAHHDLLRKQTQFHD